LFINICFNIDRKRKLPESEKLVPVITRSSSEDHTYSCIASIKLGRYRRMKILILYVQRRLHGQINLIVFHFFL